jgi:hypothetical protein
MRKLNPPIDDKNGTTYKKPYRKNLVNEFNQKSNVM